MKKGKATAYEKSDMIPLFFDTTCRKDRGAMTWEAMYNMLEEENPRPLVIKARDDAQESSDTSYFETTCSFLHRIGMSPKILPYTDMVKWVIDDVDVLDKTFRNQRQEVMGSFSPENLRLMYQLLEPQNLYNLESLDHFAKEI